MQPPRGHNFLAVPAQGRHELTRAADRMRGQYYQDTIVTLELHSGAKLWTW